MGNFWRLLGGLRVSSEAQYPAHDSASALFLSLLYLMGPGRFSPFIL